MSSPSVIVELALGPQDVETTSRLFLAYAQSLPIDLSFQDFATELAGLPSKYAASQGGALLLARDVTSGIAVGCVALRALQTPCIGEVKRLWVSSSGRGRGVGGG